MQINIYMYIYIYIYIIHALGPCEAQFIMDAVALFNVFWTVKQKHPPTAMIMLGIARTIFNITLIGFV